MAFRAAARGVAEKRETRALLDSMRHVIKENMRAGDFWNAVSIDARKGMLATSQLHPDLVNEVAPVAFQSLPSYVQDTVCKAFSLIGKPQ